MGGNYYSSCYRSERSHTYFWRAGDVVPAVVPAFYVSQGRCQGQGFIVSLKGPGTESPVASTTVCRKTSRSLRDANCQRLSHFHVANVSGASVNHCKTRTNTYLDMALVFRQRYQAAVYKLRYVGIHDV